MEFNFPPLSKLMKNENAIITSDEAENSDSSEVIATLNSENTKTISSDNFLEYKINCYALDNFIHTLNTDFNVISRKYPQQFEYDYDLYAEVYTSGITALIYKDKIHFIEKINNINAINLKGCYSNELYDMLMIFIKENNILRNKQIFITYSGHGDIGYKLKKPKNITFDKVIIDNVMKEDIQDNIIFHLENIEGSNGIILHGETGTGKSITCAAAVNEVIKLGYSACFLTTDINYSKLEDFLAKLLAPCLIILEDIDSVGQSRTDTINTSISPLLQFLNGLSEKNGKYVYIATTNHIEHLDKALSNRPIRFNRKYKFELPDEEQLDKLIDLYFEGKGITKKQKEYLHNKKFTGAYIEELKRTCTIHTLKYKKTYNEVFIDCAKIIQKNFSASKDIFGFNPKD